MTKLKRAATLFMIALLAFSTAGVAFTGGVAAETDTLTGDDTDEVAEYDANESDHLEYELTSADTDFSTDGTETVYLNITHDGNEYVATSSDVDGTNTSYTFNVSHADLEKLPGDAGQATTVTVTTWGENSTGGVTTAETSFDADIVFDETHAVRTVHASNDSIVSDFEVADDEEDDGMFSLSSYKFWSSSSDTATIEDEIGINGSQTDIHVYSNDEDVTEVFDSQLEDAEDGDRIGMMMSSNVGDGIVYVFANEPGEKISGDEVDADEDTYIVANEGGQYDVNLGEDYDGESTADLSLTAGEKFDRSSLRSDLDYSWAQSLGLDFGSLASFDWVPGLGMIVPTSGALAGLFVFGRPEIEA